MRHNITYTKYSINGKMNTILCCCTPLGVHELKSEYYEEQETKQGCTPLGVHELKLHCCHFGKWFSIVALHSECMN